MIKNYKEMLSKLGQENQQLQNQTLNDRVLIIDGLNMYIRVFGAVPALNDDGEHCGGITGFLLSTAATIRNLNPSRVIVVFDGKGGSHRRKGMYSDYKGGRTGLTKLNRLQGYEDIEDQQQSMRKQFIRLYEYLQSLPVTLLQVDYVEADDLMAWMANHYFNNEVILLSTDKDFLQLINHRIKVYSPIKKVMYDESLIKEEWGVIPQNLIWYRVIMGDSSDNIKGVNGVGAKTILGKMDFLNDGELDYNEFLSEVKQKCDDKLSKKLLEAEDTLRLNYDLMQLKSPEISTSIISNVRGILDNTHPKLNLLEFKKMFMYDKLYTAFANVDSWLKNSFMRLDNLLKIHFDNQK
jgi:DNA polymerase-1